MSPLKVLGRGYAIATAGDGRAVRSAGDVKVGDALDLRVARGRLSTQVTGIQAEADGHDALAKPGTERP